MFPLRGGLIEIQTEILFQRANSTVSADPEFSVPSCCCARRPSINPPPLRKSPDGRCVVGRIELARLEVSDEQ